jgi:hypothetical protein
MPAVVEKHWREAQDSACMHARGALYMERLPVDKHALRSADTQQP